MDLAAKLEQIKEIVGLAGWVADKQDQEPYLVEARTINESQLLRP